MGRSTVPVVCRIISKKLHICDYEIEPVYILTACLHEMGICEYVNIAHYKAACKVTGWSSTKWLQSITSAGSVDIQRRHTKKSFCRHTKKSSVWLAPRALRVLSQESPALSPHPGSTGLPQRGSPAALSSSAPQCWGTWCHQCQLFFPQYLQTVQRNFDETSIPCNQELMIITNIYFVIK